MHKNLRRLLFATCLASAGIGIAGCGPSTSAALTSATRSHADKTAAIGADTQRTAKNHPVHHEVLTDTVIPGTSGNRLQLIDVNGQYTFDPNPGGYQGKNWTGDFQLMLLNKQGKTISKLDLSSKINASSFYEQFSRKFSFHFADYNGDGDPDAALGQYASSNGYVYKLFSVKNGTIQPLPLPHGMIFSIDRSYSPLFKKIKSNAFQVTYYDNTVASSFQKTYTWNNDKFSSETSAIPE